MGLFGFLRKKEVKPESGFRERRILPRWKINGSAYIRWEGVSEDVLCRVKDLNLKGFAVSLGQAIPQGCTRIVLRFRSEYTFSVEVALLWHSQTSDASHSYGVKFTKIRDVDKEKIYKMIREDYPDLLQEHGA